MSFLTIGTFNMNPLIINQKFLIKLYTTFAVAMFVTPLQSSAGYLILCSLLFCLLTSKVTLKTPDRLYLLMLTITFLLYYFLMIPQFKESNNSFDKGAILIFATGVLVTVFRDSYLEKDKNGMYFYDMLYFIMLIFILFYLAKFALVYLGNWSRRMYDLKTFPFGYHHVDFSIIVILCFILGIRRAHFISSFLLVLFSWIILPTRTSRLFFLLFIFFILLIKIKEFKHMFLLFLPKSVFSFSIIIFSLFILLSFFFVLILPNFMEVQTTHAGLYDTSNKDRFTGFLYALQIIWNKKLLIKGVFPSPQYSQLVPMSSYITETPPHSSFLSMILYYSVLFGGLYFLGLTRWMQKRYTKTIQDGCILLSYIITSFILHDMLYGPRFFAFFCFMSIPVRETGKKIRFFSF